MEIDIDGILTINNISFEVKTVEINEDKVKLHKYPFSNIGQCNIQDVQKMYFGDTILIQNGKLLVECNECENCPMCKKVSLSIYLTPTTFQRETGYYCGQNKVYSEEINELKNSKIKGKYEIELKKSYDLIHEKFKYRREKYITDTIIKDCINDIQSCLDTQYGTYNEYGHEVLQLESMRIYRNKYGYSLSHEGRIGDDGWYNTIYIHNKCNIPKLTNALRNKFGRTVKNEI